jgi:hypothetical protein
MGKEDIFAHLQKIATEHYDIGSWVIFEEIGGKYIVVATGESKQASLFSSVEYYRSINRSPQILYCIHVGIVAPNVEEIGECVHETTQI